MSIDIITAFYSTLTNWTLEFEKWAPAIKTIIYKGPPNTRKELQNEIRYNDFQVLLTTFEYIIKDRPILSKVKWLHMIVDEGHRMKNTNSKLTVVLRQYYHTKYRLILTGTPLQVRCGHFAINLQHIEHVYFFSEQLA